MSPMNILIFRFNFAMIVHPLTTSGVHIEGQIYGIVQCWEWVDEDDWRLLLWYSETIRVFTSTKY